MRSTTELTRSELLIIVDGLQQALYLDFDSRLTKIWNPDKEWEGAEICDYLAALLAGFALIPLTVTAVADGAPSNDTHSNSNTVSPEVIAHDSDPRPTSPTQEDRPHD